MRKSIIAIVTLFTLTVQTPQPARAGAFRHRNYPAFESCAA